MQNYQKQKEMIESVAIVPERVCHHHNFSPKSGILMPLLHFRNQFSKPLDQISLACRLIAVSYLIHPIGLISRQLWRSVLAATRS